MAVLILPAYAEAPTDPYYTDCMPFPKNRHAEYPQVPEDFKWDPDVHLQIERPEFVKNLDFERVDALKEGDPNLAYSDPFRVVSDEGERRLRQVIEAHKHLVKGNARQQGILRGLGYLSQFVEDFLHDKTFLDEISSMAGEPLCPRTLGMDITQVNFGKPGAGGDVDKWHFDSCDYVLVIILSDIEGMVGGKLETLEKKLGGKEATLALARTGGVPSEFVRQQSYDRSGYGILCQGSKIMHRVTPVLEAKEDRISMVVAFTKTDVFGEDNTKALKYCKDPYDITAWEIARSEAWRQSGVMDWLIEESDPNVINSEGFAEILDEAARRLLRASRIIRGEETDEVSWLSMDAKNKTSIGDTTPGNNADRIPDLEFFEAQQQEPETVGWLSGIKNSYRAIIDSSELQ